MPATSTAMHVEGKEVEVVLAHGTPLVRPDDVVKALVAVGPGFVLGDPPILTRLAQGRWVGGPGAGPLRGRPRRVRLGFGALVWKDGTRSDAFGDRRVPGRDEIVDRGGSPQKRQLRRATVPLPGARPTVRRACPPREGTCSIRTHPRVPPLNPPRTPPPRASSSARRDPPRGPPAPSRRPSRSW